MKKLISILLFLFALSAHGQTFTVQNLTTLGTTTLASPATAVTQPTLDNTNRIATDNFVTNDLVRAKANQPVLATGGVYNLQSHGSGLQVVVFVPSGGTVTQILTIAAPGSGYAVGDVLRLAGGNIDAAIRVNTIGSGGSVPAAADVTILNGGTGYTTGAQVATEEPPVNAYNTITYTGAMTSNMTVILPAGPYITNSRLEEVNNNSTGPYTITYYLSNGSGGTIGSGIVIPQGTDNSCATWIQTDGETDVWYAAAPVCSGATNIPLSSLAAQAANTIVGNGTGATASPTALSIPSCSSANQALNWTTSTGFSCQTISTSGSGTVTSVQVSGGSTGLTFSGGPITTSGTITEAGILSGSHGGTGLTSPGASGNVLTSNGSAWVSQAPTGGSSVVNGFINGFTLANDGTTPNTVLDIAAGYAANSANTAMVTGTTFTKSTAGTWTAGSGNNGMGTSLTIAASTWYHVFAIINAGAYDVYFDTSPTAANAPAGTTSTRYIGSFKTNSSSQIIAFSQFGQTFLLSAPAFDLNNNTCNGLSILSITLSTPLGFVTYPFLSISFISSSPGDTMSIYNSTIGAVSDILTNQTSSVAGTTQTYTSVTNTSSQIQYTATGSAGGVCTIRTTGYINPHVAPNW